MNRTGGSRDTRANELRPTVARVVPAMSGESPYDFRPSGGLKLKGDKKYVLSLLV